MPLTYTRAGAFGFAHDMARVRGVGPADRPALVSAISAVLARDPPTVASVRQELVRRREGAARQLDFERAARVQAELQALEWVVAEQKATLSEPLDFDVYGWAGGVLVHFEVREGRLGAWSQSVCGETTARAWVAATPAAWVDFATRNAELAAQLARCTATSVGTSL